MKYTPKKLLIYSALTASTVLTSTVVNAAGFALREQSAYGQGSSFAGVAAGGDISTSFWNPATIGEVEGSEIQGILNIINAESEIETTGASNVIYRDLNETGDVGGTTLVPNIYYASEINDKLAWGLSLTVPFGSSTDADRGDRSQYVSLGADVSAINISPTISYEVVNNLTFAAGLQIQKFDVELSRAIPVGARFGRFSANDPVLTIEGDDTAIGYTLGATYKIGGTSLGLGYRSSIDHDLEGRISAPALGVNASIDVELETPSLITFGIKQQLSDKLSLGFTFERADWSTVGTLLVRSSVTGGVVTLGGNPVAVPLNYVDTNFYSIGGEYKYSSSMTLRSGLGYDETTVSDTTRTTQLPDNDRYWLSFGLTKQFKSFDLDVGYTYVRLKEEAEINIGPGHASFTGLPYTGRSDPTVHILSIGVTKRF